MSGTVLVKSPAIPQGADITVTAPYSGAIPDGYYLGKILTANASGGIGGLLKGFMFSFGKDTGGTSITTSSSDVGLYDDGTFINFFSVVQRNSTGGLSLDFSHIRLNKTTGVLTSVIQGSGMASPGSTVQGNMRLQSGNTLLVINYDRLGARNRTYNLLTQTLGSESSGSNTSGTVPNTTLVSGSQTFQPQFTPATRDILYGYNIS